MVVYGIMNVDTDVTVAAMELTAGPVIRYRSGGGATIARASGLITGDATLTITKQLIWSGGGMDGMGTTNVGVFNPNPQSEGRDDLAILYLARGNDPTQTSRSIGNRYLNVPGRVIAADNRPFQRYGPPAWRPPTVALGGPVEGGSYPELQSFRNDSTMGNRVANTIQNEWNDLRADIEGAFPYDGGARATLIAEEAAATQDYNEATQDLDTNFENQFVELEDEFDRAAAYAARLGTEESLDFSSLAEQVARRRAG